MTSIESRIQEAARTDSGLEALLRAGATGQFRWYTGGMMRGSAVPAVVTQLISVTRIATQEGQSLAGWARVQIKIFGGQHDAGKQACEDVGAALLSFVATLCLSSRPATLVQPSFTEERNLPYAEQDGVTYQKVVDLMAFVDESTS